ncbi:hypothetical protein TIFTF001_031356 [Ficus carica]|uniref:Uncharacterized protein n=1 Tax=Ficus carica TaxID=3494 RepID=A0AA88DV64_FICCA|nr:hypothetical protein TIFTF001_031356 [Ficus carica]
MMKMFRTDISKQARAQIFKAKKEEKVAERQLQPRQNQDAYAKGQTSNAVQHSKQFGKNKRSLREELHLQQPEPEPPVSEQECEQSAACCASQDRGHF